MSSESKEFDEVFKPADKKATQELIKPAEEQQLQTFNPQTESNFDSYLEGVNKQYLMDISRIGFKNDYDLEVNDKKVNFRRRKLSVNELKLIEQKQKEYNENIKSKSDNTLFEAEGLAKLYLEYAQMFLINSKTNERITLDEFVNTPWEDTRTIIDACLWRTIRGTSAGLG